MIVTNKIRELEEKLDKKEITKRTILGTDEERHLSEITPEYLSIEIRDFAKELAQLEQQIFKQKETEELFRYILSASLSKQDEKNSYFLTDKGLNKLPLMFARYFRPTGQFVHELHYLTIDRIKKSLLKTLDMLLKYPSSRHAWIPIWNAADNDCLEEMVPSLLGFHIQLTDAKMIFSVIIRSCDIKFLPFDLWFFLKIADFCLDYLNYIEWSLLLNVNIFNLHQYKNIGC